MKNKINFPALPKSWDALTSRQMEAVCLIRRTPDISEAEYLLRAFCMLLNISLPLEGESVPNAEGELADAKILPDMRYLFRRLDRKGKQYGEPFSMEAWEVQFFISENLKFLTGECDRLQDIFPKIVLDGKTYASTGYAMAGMTYQQHTIVQRYVTEYYRISKQANRLIAEAGKDNMSLNDTKAKIKEVKQALRDSEEIRCKMMAAFFTPESKVTDKMVDGKQVHYDPPQTDHIFSTDQIERESMRFKSFPSHKTDAVLMHYGGVMQHYKKIFPLLFKEGNGGSADFIDVEQSTLNALQSELHFGNYQSIYDSNAPFILGKLHEIVKKAKSIEEANLRMRAKSSR